MGFIDTNTNPDLNDEEEVDPEELEDCRRADAYDDWKADRRGELG